MFVIKYKKIFFTLSTLLVIASIASIAMLGLNFGIEFTGGSILEVEYEQQRPSVQAVREGLGGLELAALSVRETGEHGYIIRTQFLPEEARQDVTDALDAVTATPDDLTVARINSVGPTIGQELKRKAYYAIGVVIVAIILFVAFAFRKVSKPVSSWKYGLVAIAALIHDILIPTGLFALLGYLIGVHVDVLFVMALLAILGFSVNDTIVVFDRIRENLQNNRELKRNEPFEETVGVSLEQTYARSINTSLTTLAVLLALYFFGGESTRWFALTLVVGVLAGTYSSIFFASPLLTVIAGEKADT